jgi:hypothetical protein
MTDGESVQSSSTRRVGHEVIGRVSATMGTRIERYLIPGAPYSGPQRRVRLTGIQPNARLVRVHPLENRASILIRRTSPLQNGGELKSMDVNLDKGGITSETRAAWSWLAGILVGGKIWGGE